MKAVYVLACKVLEDSEQENKNMIIKKRIS